MDASGTRKHEKKYTLLYCKEIIHVTLTFAQKSGGRTSKLLAVVTSGEENLGEMGLPF